MNSIQTETSLIPGRTIFAVNLPYKITNSIDNWLYKAINQAVGSIQYIVPATNLQRNGSQPIEEGTNVLEHNSSAYIVFKSKQSCAKLFTIQAFKNIDYPLELHGLKRYMQEYKELRPTFSDIKKLADDYMSTFDAKEDQDQREREQLKDHIDQDGFQTVVYTKRKKINVPTEDLELLPVKKQKKKEVDNFYRFQLREKKRDQLKSLRERFEEDKAMIESIKKQQKFIPEG